MLKKEFRLPLRNKLLEPSVYKTVFFTVKFSKNNLSLNRFAFIVSKKIDKKSTVRNRYKRIFRSCIEEAFKGIRPGFDFLFILRREGVEKGRKEVCEEVCRFFEKENLLINQKSNIKDQIQTKSAKPF